MAVPLPTRIVKANQFRASLIARENAAVRFMEKHWRSSLRKIQTDIDKLTARIAEAIAKGETVNPDWLRRQREYQNLQATIINEGSKYGDDVARRLKSDTKASASSASVDYNTLTQLAFDRLSLPEPIRAMVSFNELDNKLVENIAARITPRSPAGQVIGKLGRDAAAKSRDVLIDGITRGKGLKVITRELQAASGLPATWAKTLARTEIFGAYTDTAHAHIQANADILNGWIWNAETDHCCGGCLANHGKVFTVEQFMQKHPNCRCEPIPNPKSFADLGLPSFLDDQYPDPLSPEVMQADAKSILDNSSIDDLSKRFGIGKAKLIDSGKVQLDDLATVIPSQKWGGSTVETPLKDLLANVAK